MNQQLRKFRDAQSRNEFKRADFIVFIDSENRLLEIRITFYHSMNVKLQPPPTGPIQIEKYSQ